MEFKDYYKSLEVDKNASQQEIRKAYRRLAKKYHPDSNPGNKQAEERFKEISEAYEVLGDEERRKKYDQMGSQPYFTQGFDFDPSQFGFGGGDFHFEYSGNGFSDFFNAFFGDNRSFDDIFSGMSGTRSQSVGGQDVQAEIEITPEEGMQGVDKMVTLRIGGNQKQLSIKIPKGIKDGEKIRLKGQGEPGYGGKTGDLYLTIRMKNSSKFEIQGLDLTTIKDIYPWDAALGCEITIDLPDNQILIKVPKGVQTDQRLRVPGKGYMDRKGNRGNLYIKFRIINPKNITAEMEKYYEKLKNTVGKQ